jgi:hypothetical protein
MPQWGYSPLAVKVPGSMDPSSGRIRSPFGMCLHTTGRGIVKAASGQRRKAIDVALELYLESQSGALHGYRWGGPTYLMDYDGSLHQFSPDEVMTFHAGGPDREDYLDGDWIHRMPGISLVEWRKAWPLPHYKSPQHLYPGRTANTPYVGVEMLPIGFGQGGEPRGHCLFTQAQHEAAIALGRDLAARHRWPADWAQGPRLVGHEDVQPLERSDRLGGWDPGARRERPYWDDAYVRGELNRSGSIGAIST